MLMGQSLGALAALHAVWTDPGVFAGLFLQSGSYFTADLDPQESGFEFWPEVTGFVASVRAAEQAAPDAPVTTLTCGTAEENHANNLAMRESAGPGRRRDRVGRDPRRSHLDLLARHPRPLPDRPARCECGS